MKYFTKLPIVLLIAVALASCEKQEYFKSESQVKKDLNFSWKQVLMSQDTNRFPNYQIWTFNDDVLTIIRKKVTNNATIDTLTGNYSVNTTMTKVYINTANFPDNPAWYWLNAEWNVVLLDSKGLVIASEDPKAGGINEREFSRMD